MNHFKKIAILIFISLCAILIQGTIFRTFMPTVYLPNLLFGILVFISFAEITVFGVFAAFSVGLMLDLFSSQLIGPWAGSYVAVFALFSLFAQRVYVGSYLVVAVTAGFASIFASIVYIFITAPYGAGVQLKWQVVLFEALFSAIVAPFVFSILQKVYPKEENSRAGMGRSYL